MNAKISPAVVGLFVLGALALGVFALLSFGGINPLQKPERFAVIFDESVHGLELGSPVKLRGVRVGRVVGLDVIYNAAEDESRVHVLCELTQTRFGDSTGSVVDVSEPGALDELIDRGLRAQLGILGLATGLLYVELDFLSPTTYPRDLSQQDPTYATVPAVPSTIAEFQNNLSQILTDINQVNFASLGQELEGLVVDTRRELQRANLPALSNQWLRVGASVDSLVNSREVQDLLANLTEASATLQATLAEVNRQVATNGDELQDTLLEAQEAIQAFNQAAGTIDSFVEAQRGVGEDVAAALRQVSDAANAVQRLTEYLERNPNALLLGRRTSN